ncbi:MAG: RnfABCDGE type electron transport complex subunit D [Balneolaceae bacterium]
MTEPLGKFSLNRKYAAPLLITAILFAAHISYGILGNYGRLLTAIGTALVAEAVLHRVVTGRWRDLSSAYISGISVGILVRSPFFWPYMLCSLLSVLSKYVIRHRGTHIWNPSNFGVVALLLIAWDDVAILSIQWGNNMWAMLVIWIVGFVTIYRIRRFHICATYVLSFVAFAAIRSWMTGGAFLAELSPITGPMYQLFVFFMITDPKTTVQSRKGQYLIAFLIAAVEMVFRLNESIYAPFYALAIVGPASMIIEGYLIDRKERIEGVNKDNRDKISTGGTL